MMIAPITIALATNGLTNHEPDAFASGTAQLIFVLTESLSGVRLLKARDMQSGLKWPWHRILLRSLKPNGSTSPPILAIAISR
jgi:hypothetical protein